MKKIIAVIILTTFALMMCLQLVKGQSYPPPTGAGRIFQGATLPATKPTGFNAADFYYLIPNGTTYQLVNNRWQLAYFQVKDSIPSTVKNVYTEQQLRDAFAGYSNGNTTCINVMRSITLTQALQYPTVIQPRKVVLNLQGNTLIDGVGLQKMICRPVANQDDALNRMITTAIVIRDGTLRGNNLTGTLLELTCTYGSIVEGVDFVNGEYGCYFRFCLMGVCRNSLANGIRNTAYVADMGDWIGANNVNSQSNSSRFEQCRVFAVDGSFTGFADYAASGMIHEQCIVEGKNSKHAFFVDTKASTVVKDGLIHFSHIENQPTVSAVELSLGGGYYIVDGLFSQYPTTLVNAKANSNYPHVKVRNVAWHLSGHRYGTTGTAVVWEFDEIPATPLDLANGSAWNNGLLPYYYSIKGYNQSLFHKTNTQNITGTTNFSGVLRSNGKVVLTQP